MVKLEVLGPGCKNCERLADNVREAAADLDLDYELVKIEDLNEITSYGVMNTPGLAVNGDVKIQGEVASVADIQAILEDYN